VDALSRSILLGGREWRSAVDQPIANPTPTITNPDVLAAAFAAAWSASPDRALPPGTGAKLVELCVHAHQTHPSLPIDDVTLVATIASRAPVELDAYLERCHAADLALAILASARSIAAITELERMYRMTIDSTCRRFAGPTHTAEDLKQILRTKLYVAEPGKTPKLADYAGQGFLENWLRVTAVRIFLDLAKRKDRAREALPGEDDVLALPEPSDLALDVVKAEYREAVAAAMREAAKQLEPGDRHLLRQHFVAGLSIDQLGAVLGIHRATAARRIARAREQLVADTRKELARRLQLDPAELDEVIGLVMSRLDVSIGKLLATSPLPAVDVGK
jgi:RNA polymerase sigma-70 factor (ECF subfamily)